MKSKIALTFEKCKKEKRAALITYTVAGDNTKDNSLKILNSISKYADILELGFPHNTPIADGGQIQESSHRALKNGIKLKNVFQIVKKFRKSNPDKPLILMGYYNLVYQSGEDKEHVTSPPTSETASSSPPISKLGLRSGGLSQPGHTRMREACWRARTRVCN